MLDLLALPVAFLLIFVARMIRSVGGTPFEVTRADWTSKRPVVGMERFEEAFEEARALGFGEPRWVLVEGVAS